MLPSPAHKPEPHGPIRILYAEDVAELRDLARVVFSRDGHHIDCVVDGVEALDTVAGAEHPYDLVLTDHHMPRMNGLDVVKNLRRSRFAGKIVVFSSELSPLVAAEYQAQGVDRILFKPVYPSYLRTVLAELFPAAATAAPV